MAMDNTELFKAVVKTVRLRLKAVKRDTGSLNDALFKQKNKKEKSEFFKLAINTRNNITALKQFLLTNQKDYVDTAGYLSEEFSRMSDEERDLIENEAEKLIKTTSEHFNGLRQLLSKTSSSSSSSTNDTTSGNQCKEHREAMLSSLQSYSKDVVKLFSDLKALRLKRIIDKKRAARLVPESWRSKNSNNTSRDTPSMALEAPPTTPPSETTADNSITSTTEHASTSQIPQFLNDTSHEVEGLSPDEIEKFEQENALMFNNMSSLVDEVRAIESKVVEVTRLQEMFSEKVLEQAEQLDTIYQTTVTATENISDGNEQVINAIRNKGSLRMWILFIIVVCSFTLLFLDWYS